MGSKFFKGVLLQHPEYPGYLNPLHDIAVIWLEGGIGGHGKVFKMCAQKNEKEEKELKLTTCGLGLTWPPPNNWSPDHDTDLSRYPLTLQEADFEVNYTLCQSERAHYE